MRLLLLILFVSCVLAEEAIVKNDDKRAEADKDVKNSVDETKSKTGKRDSSDQTGSFGINPNDEPFKPMINSPTAFVAAASNPPQVYHDKNHVMASESAGNGKATASPQAANGYRTQYSQVAQHQQQTNKNNLRANGKNLVIQQQQQNLPSILYASSQNPAYHYERIPQQQEERLQVPPPLALALQRGQQKQMQYIIAIPMTYLRQLQQQVVHQQLQEQQAPLQVYKGQQQQQHPSALAVPVYSIAGPLARDHQGSYRPFHRFTLPAVNDVSTAAQHQTGPAPTVPQPVVTSPATPSRYTTQYIPIPVNVLLAAMQSAQVLHQPQQQQQQQQQPVHLPQQIYQPHQQPYVQLPLQQPIQLQQQQLQQIRTHPPQLYYYQPQQHQLQLQLKQSHPSQALMSPPVYGYHVNHLQQQQQQQHLSPLNQQQSLNVDKHTHIARDVKPTANLTPTQQYDSTAAAYESDEKSHLITLQAPAHSNSNAQSQQYIAQGPAVRQQQQPSPAHQLPQLPAPESYEHVVHYNPQYVQQYQEQHEHPYQAHRLQVQSHLNNFKYSQGTSGSTTVPFLRLPTGETSLYNLNEVQTQIISPSVITGGFAPSYNQLGIPNKMSSLSNVQLQPLVGHHSAYHIQEIAGSAKSIPYGHSASGIHYGPHLYHPPTSATTVLTGNKPHNLAGHPDTRVLSSVATAKSSTSSAKTSVPAIGARGNPTIVKYP